jgi:large subunit ribosomal protein MRP49
LQRALRPEGGLLPQRLDQRGSSASFDTYENRLVRDLVERVLRRARRIGALAAQEQRRLSRNSDLLGPAPQLLRLAEVAAACVAAEQRLRRLMTLPMLAQARPLSSYHGPTAVLERSPLYRPLYRRWLAERQSPELELDSPLFHLPLQDLPALYESWCAVEVARGLLALPGWEALPSPCLVPATSGLVLQLPTDVPLLELRRGDETTTLRYQPRYRPRRGAGEPLVSLDRHTRVPDLAIELRRPGAPVEVLVLDAKYRLDAGGGVPEDALADAYAYRGSIGDGAGRQAVRAALLLYPGSGIAEIYTSGVGGMPLLPGGEAPLRAWLRDALGEPVTG